MSIDASKSKSRIGSIGYGDIFEVTKKLLINDMNYKKLSKKETLPAIFALVILSVFPVFVGCMLASTMLAIDFGLPSFLHITAALFYGTLYAVLTFAAQFLLMVCVLWIAGFIKHLSS